MDKSYKRKNYYQNQGGRGGKWNTGYSNKKFKHYLTPGMKGFFCTCNMREKDCVKESLNILNEYAEKIVCPEEALPPKSGEGGDTGDIEDQLQAEVSQLKSTPRELEKFVAVDTGIKNGIFIKTTIEDPVKLAYTIIKEAAETKVQKGRFLLRIVPVEVVCKSNLEDMKTAADALFDKHFRCEPTTFAIVINKRYNNSILRDEVITALALLVTDKNQEHKANLKEPHKTVLLEIMKGLCCMSVLEEYNILKRYNLAELTKPETTEAGPSSEDGEEKDMSEVECDNGNEPEEIETAEEKPQDTAF